MTAENGNGNGELRQLLEIKRAYRKGLTSFEEELKVQFERDLADGKKRLKEKDLENVVDAVFAESVPVTSKVEVVESSAPSEPESPKCPECGSPVDPMDKFCAECAFPLTEEVKNDAPVPSAGRQLKPRRR
jgi:hypothetical protein